jgi:hypothetical protein
LLIKKEKLNYFEMFFFCLEHELRNFAKFELRKLQKIHSEVFMQGQNRNRPGERKIPTLIIFFQPKWVSGFEKIDQTKK